MHFCGQFSWFTSKFTESEVHLTAIQALSNHKQEYAGWHEEFFQENSKRCENWLVLWPEMGGNGHF